MSQAISKETVAELRRLNALRTKGPWEEASPDTYPAGEGRKLLSAIDPSAKRTTQRWYVAQFLKPEDVAFIALLANNADAILSSLERAERMEARPIETAVTGWPFKKVLLYWPETGWSTGKYTVDDCFHERPKWRKSPSEGFCAEGDQCIPINQPTHWMPLPEFTCARSALQK